MSLYLVAKGMTSGACSNGGEHGVVVLTDCTVSVCVELNVLMCIVINKDDILTESSIVE